MINFQNPYDFPNLKSKRIFDEINSIFGINRITTRKIIGVLGLHPKSTQISKRTFDQIWPILSNMRISFRLRLIIFSRLCLLISLNSYRGLRILQGLPTRGQRTHANGKTLKNLRKSGKFFPFKIKLYRKEVLTKKNKKPVKTPNKKPIKKITSKQKAKIKAKNKAKAKARKKNA